ncbi:MAG: flagellar hook-associated protein FlgK [Candidatus Riflebacteria bacterium]|nr:flagellar hook-associated protein FlgK [Candidatus Riflebacteria bacterium]
MSSTFFGIELGKRAIMAQRTSMDVTSQNIANANTDGYSRQRADLTATAPWSTPDMYNGTTLMQVGTGVGVDQIKNFRDAFIDTKITKETSTLAKQTASDDIMKQVESIMNEPGTTNIRDQLDKFWASWQNLSVNPSDTALRANVKEEGDALVAQFKDVDSQLRRLQGTPDHSMQGSIENQLEDSLSQVNAYGQQIANLNVQIGKAETGQGQANDLRDKRQVLVEKLANLVNAETSTDSKGLLSIRVGRHMLVDNGHFSGLYMTTKTSDDPGTISDSKDYPNFSDHPEIADAITTNTTDNRNLTVSVEQTAQAERQYSFLTFHPLNGPLSNFGASSGNFTVNGRTFQLDAQTTDMNGLVKMINDANINVNAKVNEAGQLVMESALTGTANTISLKDGTSNIGTILNLKEDVKARDAIFVVNGHQYVTAENKVTDAIPGVTLLIKKSGVANMNLEPIVTGGKIKGLLETRDGNVKTLRDQLDEMAYKLVTEVNAVHRQGFGLDGVSGRNFFKPITTTDPNKPYLDAVKNLALDDSITSDGTGIAAAKGSYLNPTDCLPSYNGDGDGSNAIAIAQVAQKDFFFDGKATFSDFINKAVTQVATDSQTTGSEKSYSNDLMTQLKSERDSVQGVNLDEELTNIIKFQQAYNAASKVVATVDAMLDKIINGMLT